MLTTEAISMHKTVVQNCCKRGDVAFKRLQR